MRQSLMRSVLSSGAIVALFFVVAGTAQADSIAVHWNSYGGNSISNVPAATADGIQLPDSTYNSNWTNLQVNWYTGGASNLQDNNGNPTTAAVTTNGPFGSYGTYWYDGSYTSSDALLNGPWGQNGAAIPNAITGIPYANYDIIAYTNPPYGTNPYTVWLDSNPGSTNAANAPVAGSQYWFSPDSGNGAGIGVGGNFDLMTDNYDSNQADFPGGNFPTQNTVVYTGLSGPDQTIWTDSVPNGVGNYGIIGFEIVAVPEPSSFALLGLGIVGITGFGLRRRKLAAV